MHITFVLANNSTAPYFTWFARKSSEFDDIRFSFVCMYKERPEMIGNVEKWGCKCYWVKYDSTKRKKDMLSAVPKLLKLFRKIKPDVVHTHLFDDSLPALLAARTAGVKVRAITKGDAAFHYFFTPQWVKFDRLNNWNATDIVAISNQNKEFILKKEKADPKKVHLIPHGIPIPEATDQKEAVKNEFISKFGLKGKKVIGTIARLIEWKGHHYIIEAAEKVVKQHQDIVFLFAGTGHLKEELMQLIAKKKLDKHFIFTGWIAPVDIPSFYGVLDVYLHAASNEPFGFVIAEAMANGLPVVSTRTGVAADAIHHKKNGYLAEEKDAESLVDGISFMLNSKNRSTVGSLARKSVERNYNFERMWSNYLNLYKKALAMTSEE